MAAKLLRRSQLSTPANAAALEQDIEDNGGVGSVRGFGVDGDVGWVLIDAVVPPPGQPPPGPSDAMQRTTTIGGIIVKRTRKRR